MSKPDEMVAGSEDEMVTGSDEGRLARVRARIRKRRSLDLTYRAMVLVSGLLIVFAGLGMLFLPGPGWATIFVGFAVLATEFTWARRALIRAKFAAHRARERALDPRVRRRNALLATGATSAVVAAAVWYLVVYGLPDNSWIPGL